MKEWTLRALLVVAGFAIAVLGAELYLRKFNPQPTNVLRMRPDGVLSHVPNLDVVVHGVDSRARVTTNADGLRDIERPRRKPPGVTRVLVLGDSMIEGLQVALEDTMPRRLAVELRAAMPAREIDVINAGVSGSSGPQAARYLETDGLGYDPDLVIVAITLRNDIHEAADTRVFALPPLYELRVLVRSHSHLYGLIEKALNRSAGLRNALSKLGIVSATRAPVERFDPHAISSEVYLYDGALAPDELLGYERLFESYERILALTRERGIPVLFVLIPSYFQVSGYAAALGDPARVAEIFRHAREPQERMLAFFRERGLEPLDLLPAARGRAEEYYLPRDQHFTAAGHAFAAKETARAIIERGLLATEPAQPVAAPGAEAKGG